MTLDYLARVLAERGMTLGRAADANRLHSLEQALSLKLGSEFRSLYSTFDGFEEPDNDSQLWLWSISKIIPHGTHFGVAIRDGVKWLTVGDFLIESDLIAVSAEQDTAKVILLEENRLLADSVGGFLEGICTGRFDI